MTKSKLATFLSMLLLLLAALNGCGCTSAIDNYPFETQEDGHEVQGQELPAEILSYVHLTRRYYIVGNGTFEMVNESVAGGVCVQVVEGDCLVLTVDHWCRFDVRIQLITAFSESYVADHVSARTWSSSEEQDVTIVAQDPARDLCLVRTPANGLEPVDLVSQELRVDPLTPVYNVGAPIGYFSPADDGAWTLHRKDGYWSGWCDNRCRFPFPSTVRASNLIMHTIPTNVGQSGSGIFLNGQLFSIQVGTNATIDDFGIGASLTSIYEFLESQKVL